PQRGKQRAAHFGFDLVFQVMLERLGPDSAADVVDQNVDTSETLLRHSHHPMTVGKPLKIGGQGEYLTAPRPQLIGQLVDHLGTVHCYQPSTLSDDTLGDATANPLCRTADNGDFVFKTLVHLPNLSNGKDCGG